MTKINKLLFQLALIACSFTAFAVEFINPMECRPEYTKTTIHYYRQKALRMIKAPYNIVKIPVKLKGNKKLAPSGKYDIYLKLSKKDQTPVEISLGDTIKVFRIKPTHSMQWVGPVRIKAANSFNTIKIRATDNINVSHAWLQNAKMTKPEALKAKPVSSCKEVQTVWIAWPDNFQYPYWITDSAEIKFSYSSYGQSKKNAIVKINTYDYMHKKVSSCERQIALGDNGSLSVKVPKAYGPYLFQFSISLPNKQKQYYQKIVSRISAPAKFYSDKLGGHGNYELLSHLGAGWDRIWNAGQNYLLWQNFEREKGKFNLNFTLPPKPLKLMAVFSTIPKWGKDPIKDMTGWSNYVKNVVKATKGKIEIYEIFNENYHNGYAHTEKYAKVIKATTAIIKKEAPNALVATGGPPEEIRPGLLWWEKTVKAGVFDPVDIITAHLYFGAGGTHPLDQDIRFDAYVTALRRILDAHGLGKKPLIDSESGLAPLESFYLNRNVTYGLWGHRGFSPRKPVPYKIGTAMAARFLLLHFYHRVTWYIYHMIAEYGNAWAIADYEGTPLPAAVTIAQLTRFFDKAEPDGKPELPNKLWGIRFKKANKSIIALWAVNLDFGEKRYISGVPDNIRIFDMFMNTVTKSDEYKVGIEPLIFAGEKSQIKVLLKDIKVVSRFDRKQFSSKTSHIVLTSKNYNDLLSLKANSTEQGYSLDVIRDGVSTGIGTQKDSWTYASNPKEVKICYTWKKPQKIDWITAGWAMGHLPQKYLIEWFDGIKWRICSGTPRWRGPMQNAESYPVSPFKTTKLRMRIKPVEGKKTKVTEFSALSIPRVTPPVSEMQEIYNEDFFPNKNGYITDWLVCGPFPAPGNRFQKKDKPSNWKQSFLSCHYHYGYHTRDNNIKPKVDREHIVEFPKVLAETWPCGKMTVSWNPYHNYKGNFVDLQKAVKLTGVCSKIKNKEQCYAYAICYINLAKDFEGLLSIGSDDGYRIMIDKKLFAEKVVFRSSAPDQEKYPLKLSKGEHRILLKVHNDIGGHGFYLRLLKKSGKPFKDYKIKIVP